MVKDAFLISSLSALAVLSACESPIMPDPSPINYEDFVDNQDQFPAFSPDGSKIAYFHFDTPQDPDYPTGLYIIDRDGGNRTLVLEGIHLDPDWSPDGQWLVFSSQGIIQKCTIHGDSLTTFSSPFEFGIFSPDWMANWDFLITNNFGEDWNTYTLSSDFSVLNELFDFKLISIDLQIDSFQNSIVYYRGGENVDFSDIFTISLSEKNEIRLTNGGVNRAPTWSPSGNQIAWSNNVRIYIMNSDGSHQHYLHYGNRPSWSVNDEIVFSFANEDMSREVLYTIKPDGSQLTQITF